MPDIKTAPYFTEVVLRKRPYLTLSIVAKAIATAEVRLVQSNGRIRLWSRLEELNGQALRVVLLPDGVTVLNAFIDRDAPLPPQQEERRPE